MLGRLFRVDTDSVCRTELIILITPYVVRNREEAHSITEEFENRIRGLKGMIERVKPTKPPSAPTPGSTR